MLNCVAESALELLCADQDWHNLGLETHLIEAVEVEMFQAELNILSKLHPILAAVIFKVLHQCVVMALEEFFNVAVFLDVEFNSNLLFSAAICLLSPRD